MIWILAGDRYTVPKSLKLKVKVGQQFKVNQPIANETFRTNTSGIVQVIGSGQNREINLTESSAIIENGFVNPRVEDTDQETFQLATPNGNKLFNLTVNHNDILTNGQTVASLNEAEYQTQTGGVVYYSTELTTKTKKRNTKQLFKGSLYWVPEETHKYNPKTLLIQEGAFITKGSLIDANTISNIDDLHHYKKTEVIKTGELYEINDTKFQQIRRKPIYGTRRNYL